MRLVGLRRLEEFLARHADMRTQVAAWVCEVEEAEWRTPSDIKRRFPSASFLTGSRVVFNLKGNKYRLDTEVNFEYQLVVIVRIGTHADYSKWKF